MKYSKYLFIDRDGTLIEEPSDFQIDSFEKFKLAEYVIPSLIELQKSGFIFVMVSNQDGLGTKKYPLEHFDMIQKLLMGIFSSQGIKFEAIRICPHLEEEKCFCRKPQVGLVRDFMQLPELDRNRSYVIGDRATDRILAENMGINSIQIGPEYNWKSITNELLSIPRKGQCIRKTKETSITANVCLNQESASQISTGIGFFDHMLEQLSYHGAFSLKVSAQGDLHIDDHHLIEDTAIVIGTALRQALGDKIGIERFGFSLPMDDASAQVMLDLSGRNYFRFDANFQRTTIGNLSTEMIPHFFRSFAESLGANLHITISGENTHHQIESAFKAVGRSIRAAIQQSASLQVPSTKGVL